MSGSRWNLVRRARQIAGQVHAQWRRLGWEEVGAETYRREFDAFGGSLHVHPLMMQLMESLSGRRVRYFVLSRAGRVVAALPMVGSHIGATPSGLAHWELNWTIDIGVGTEVILPVKEGAQVRIPAAVTMLSDIHQSDLLGMRGLPDTRQMLARGYSGNEAPSGRSLKGRRRQLRRFTEAGGSAVATSAIDASVLADTYVELFHKRWGRSPVGYRKLSQILATLAPLLRGFVLYMDSRPIAVDIDYAHLTPRGLLGVCVNGGLDPDYRHFSPGSVLLHLTIEVLTQEASEAEVGLRLSLGADDAEYKSIWCYSTPVFDVR